MPFEIDCPLCRKRLSVPDPARGKKIRCPACAGVVDTAQLPAAAAPPPAPAEPTRACPHCGQPIPASARKCFRCLRWISEAPAPAPPPVGAPARTSGAAVTSLILGILSMATCVCWPAAGIMAIVAVLGGIRALSDIRVHPDVGGKGMAVAGIVCGGVALATGLLMAIVSVMTGKFFPWPNLWP
jgi:hypothetical protein